MLNRYLLVVIGAVLLCPPAGGQTTPLPDSERVEFMLFEGGLLLEEGKYVDAAAILSQVVALDPGHFEARLGYARALTRGLLSGQFEDTRGSAKQALHQYQWVLDHNPDPFVEHEARKTLELLSTTYLREEAIPLETEAGRDAWREARKALENGDTGQGIRALRRAIRAEPTSAAAHKALGLALLDSDQVREGKKEMRRALELDPADEEARTLLGQVLEEEGRTEEALEHFRQALGEESTYVPAAQGVVRLLGERELTTLNAEDLAVLGQAQVALDRPDRAVVTLEAALEAGAGPQARKALAVAEFLEGNDPRVVTLLEEVQPLRPEDLEVLYYLGASNLRLGRVQEGRGYLGQLLALDPENPNALRLLGLSLADEPDRAAEAIDILLRADRGGARINRLSCILGTLYMQTGQPQRAEQMLLDCLSQAPEFAAAHLGLGILADDRGQNREAIEHFERYLDLEPEPEQAAIFRLGVAYLRSGQDEKGYEALRRLLRSNAVTLAGEDSTEVTDTRLLEATSFFLASAHRYEDAIFIGEILLTHDPENAIYNNNLAMTYADANHNLGRAHALAMKANRLSPDNPGHLDTLGWAQLRMGQYGEAEKTLKRSIELAGGEGRSDLSEIYYHLGFLYHLIDRYQDAEKYLTMALEDPPTPYIRTEIERLLDLVEKQKP